MLPSISRFTRRAAIAALATVALGAQANEGRWTYEVTVTNITYNQRFTPLLLATHKPEIRFFTLGQPAISELVTLAEEGNVAPLRALLQASPLVNATAAGNGLLDPGKSISFQIQGNPWRDRLSLAAMLIPTNDAFVSLDAVQLPYPGWPAQTYTVELQWPESGLGDLVLGEIDRDRGSGQVVGEAPISAENERIVQRIVSAVRALSIGDAPGDVQALSVADLTPVAALLHHRFLDDLGLPAAP